VDKGTGIAKREQVDVVIHGRDALKILVNEFG
jgi:hypothetical protein